MTEAASSSDSEQLAGHQRMLALLLAMAMFVLIVDTSLMNVSIASVVRDLVRPPVVFSRPSRSRPGFRRLHPDRRQTRRSMGRKRAYVFGLLRHWH